MKSLFGGHAIYVGGRIVMITRKKDRFPEDNGVWIAVSEEYHESLKNEFPQLRKIKLLGSASWRWQVIPEELDNFETSVLHLCSLIVAGDKRIGKVTKGSKKQK